MDGEVTPGLPRRGPEREAAVELMQIVDSEGYKPRAQIASCESPLAATSINSRGDWGRGDWKPPFGTRDGSWRCEWAVGRQVLGIGGEGRRRVPGVPGQKGRAQWARVRLGGGGCGRITGAVRVNTIGCLSVATWGRDERASAASGTGRQFEGGLTSSRRCWPRFYIMRKGPLEEGGCERSGCRDVPGRGPGDTVAVNCICATLARPIFRQGS
ncbi:hypothetical protein B0H16DRAFT_1477467 [Mycena metata]|uniref:Uncharacterized protein n=1 Tax=Mycena metata TaxID=1033252 RepID=A0AAD7H9N0_9AGAR|nr:hypothetical protein B0H16DRAFT_1477467 [Mycena metata]